MSSLLLWKQRLRPAYLAGEARRVGGKIVDRVRRPHRRVAALAAAGERRGRALVSYLVDPFLVPDGSSLPHTHTHFWESRQIARTFRDLGFDVDVIHWTNREFVPEKRYDAFVDVRLNLERLAPLLGDRCLRIQHMETAHHLFHNRAQRRRLADLEARRGVRLRPRKLIEENRAIENAHYGTTVGNRFTIETYAHAGREIHRVPLSTPLLFPSPAGKDFERCRRRFVWFGSGGLVHKGLDLVLEAFAATPELELVVCGPVHLERDFQAHYARELYGTPNIETAGWVDIAGERFRRIAESSVALVYPSCSEAGGGSAITCLHAGLIPVVTHETSIDLEGFGVELREASVEAIREAALEVAGLPAAELERLAVGAWEHARREHTRERFAAEHRRAIERILADWERSRG